MCVCMRAFAHMCVQVTAFTSGPAQHHFDFPAEITSCTCSTWAHTHTHIVFNCNGAFCESHSASCLFLHHSWNEGENISCQCVRKKMTIIDFLVYFSDLFISFCPHSTSRLSFPSFCILCFSHRWNKMHNKTWQKPIPLCYHRNTTWQRILLN